MLRVSELGRLQGAQSPQEKQLRAVELTAPEIDQARWCEARGRIGQPGRERRDCDKVESA